jgi:hypothetical protein
MSLSLSDDEIHGLIAYARVKFADERYPFASALRPVREALAKLDPKPVPQPPAPKKPYVPSLVLQRKNQAAALTALACCHCCVCEHVRVHE